MSKGKNKKKELKDNYGFIGESCFSYGQLLIAANPFICHYYENDPVGMAFLGFFNVYSDHIGIICQHLPDGLNLNDLSEKHQLHLLTVNRGILISEVQKISKYYDSGAASN